MLWIALQSPIYINKHQKDSTNADPEINKPLAHWSQDILPFHFITWMAIMMSWTKQGLLHLRTCTAKVREKLAFASLNHKNGMSNSLQCIVFIFSERLVFLTKKICTINAKTYFIFSCFPHKDKNKILKIFANISKSLSHSIKSLNIFCVKSA